MLAGILEGLGWRDVCRAAAASRVFLEAGRSQRVLSFDGVDTEDKVLGALCCLRRTCSHHAWSCRVREDSAGSLHCSC